jgi:hypothetical protein
MTISPEADEQALRIEVEGVDALRATPSSCA